MNKGKNGSTEHSKGNNTVPEKGGYNTYRGWIEIDCQDRYQMSDKTYP